MRAVKSVSIDSERRVIITFLDGSTETLLPELIWGNAEVINSLSDRIDDLNDDVGELKENLTDLQELADTKAAAIYETASGAIASFSDGADDMPMKSCVVNIEPIQEGTGDPSPENVRPISGRTGLSVVRAGKNLLWKARQSSTMNGITWTLNDDGSITASGTSTGRSYIRIIVFTRDAYTLPKGTYTYSLTPTGSDYTNIHSLIGAYKGNKYYKNVCAVGSSNNFAKVFEWNDSDLAAVLDIAVEVEQENKTVNCTVYPQIELGSIATDYEPYKGSTHSVNWETEAGAVYGGTFDDVSGKLTVDRAMVDLGTLTWEYNSSDKRFYCRVYGWKEYTASQVANAICSQYYPVSRDNLLSFDKCFSISTNVISFINICDTAYSDATTFKTAMNGVQLVYELATPTEIQLTPQEIRTLLGINNVWSDGGDVTAEYPADTKMYIDTKIAEAIAAAMA